MVKDLTYYGQARLLLRILPLLDRYPVFAIKGGTAINFFIRDMPRLSVDIDLTYIPLDERATALATIDAALQAMKSDIERVIAKASVLCKKADGSTIGLFVRAENVMVKIEPNTVLRGTIFEPVTLPLSGKVQEMFEVSVKVKSLAIAEIYGGKICAALDRQHPRDLFDIMLLLQNEGITDEIRKSFIVSLISHDRPMAELLDPNFHNIEAAFANEFEGMTFIEVRQEDLIAARDQLVKSIRETLTEKERQFILSVKKGDPQWSLIGIEGIERLPGIAWKLLNIKKMRKAKHKKALDKLERCLGC